MTGYHSRSFMVERGAGDSVAVTAADLARCFIAGTRILTDAGEMAVEMLRPGMMVPTLLGGGLGRAQWVGRTRVDLDRHPNAAEAGPVRVHADAFAPGVPHRDLLVSPDHALFAGGRLIPAYLLVNGMSITREPPRGVVTYVHVELATHDLVLAEGLAAETYLDTGNRGQFAGEAGVRTMHPEPCAELGARA